MVKIASRVFIFLFIFFLLSSCKNKVLKEQAPATQANQLKNLVPNPADTLTFRSGIRCIYQDSKGHYWFGSHQEGVCRFDGTSFEYFTSADGLPGDQVYSITEDNMGTIWLWTNKGVGSLDTNVNSSFQSNKILPVINRNWQPSSSDIWVGSENSGELTVIHEGKAYRFGFSLANKQAIDGLQGVTGFSKGKNGTIWMAYYSGVTGFDGHRFTVINDSTMHYDGTTDYMHVRSILEDSKGRLWVGNNSNGVLLKEGDSIINFSRKFGLVDHFIFKNVNPSPPGTLLHVFAIGEDSSGNIWFGDRDTGAWRYDGREIKNMTVDPRLKSPHIWDIYEDKHGNLLFAMAEGGVYRYNGSGFHKVF